MYKGRRGVIFGLRKKTKFCFSKNLSNLNKLMHGEFQRMVCLINPRRAGECDAACCKRLYMKRILDKIIP